MSKDKDGSYQKALDCLDVAASLRSILREEESPLYQYAQNAQIVVIEAVVHAILSVADTIKDKEKEIFCPSCFRKVK